LHPLLAELGGETSHGGRGQVIVQLQGHRHAFHGDHHSPLKDEARTVRKFITEAAIDPAPAYAW